MSEFVGRTGSLRLHSYPDTRRRGGGDCCEFARNYATGKAFAIESAEFDMQWTPDVGDPGTEVPITPLSTGVVEISGTILIDNGSGDDRSFTITVSVDGSSLTPTFTQILPAGIEGVIPFIVQVDGLAIGVQVPVAVSIEAEAGSDMEIEGGTLAIQEVAESTG